jgi:phosphatidylglycerol:prolipoprotein diacylglycerol transferase
LARRKRFDGEIILGYTFLYAIVRFLLEYLRGDADRGFVFGGILSTSQFIAVILVFVSVVLYVMQRGVPLHRNGVKQATKPPDS